MVHSFIMPGIKIAPYLIQNQLNTRGDRIMKKITLICALFFSMLVVGSAFATSLTIDEIVYQPTSGLNPTKLAGTADATFISSNVLTITLTNTSADLGVIDNFASAILTGIGFNLPSGVTITGGDVTIPSGSNLINPPASYDLSEEWGWGGPQSPFQTGHYVTGIIGFNASTLQASISHDFTGDSAPPANVDGPYWGLLSDNQSTSSNQQYIIDSIVITLNLSGYSGNETDLINFINQNDVALAFGSPTGNAVPEPATMLLLGFGLVGFWGLRRKFNK